MRLEVEPTQVVPPTRPYTLTGLTGNEMVFDNVFIGASNASHAISADSGQSALWNVLGYSSSSTSFNVIGAASTKPAPGTSTSMSWTTVNFGTTTTRWAIAAVPIRPAPTGPTYNLTLAVNPSGAGTTNPPVGVNAVAQGSTVTVTATANTGYAFSSWSGDCTGSGSCSVTMNGNKSVTANFASSIEFTGTELLGRPEANSISVSVVPDSNISLYYEWGTTSGSYTGGGLSTQTTATAGTPKVVVMSGLSSNTHYFYRMQYSTNGGSTWLARPEKSFWTQRAAGVCFVFDVTSDSHINIQLGNQTNWTSTMNGVLADSPDFLIDLGDTFAMDNGSTSVTLGDTAAAELRYTNTLPTFNIISGSSPIFLTPGNHEQQEAWHLNPTSGGSCTTGCLPIMGKNAEKKYFLNPVQ